MVLQAYRLRQDGFEAFYNVTTDAGTKVVRINTILAGGHDIQCLHMLPLGGHWTHMAERVGFEPTVPCGTHAFQACALSHSAISPGL